MSIDRPIELLKKKGFRDTFQILTPKNRKMEKHEFYKNLNQFSYYNSFFRVKDELIDKGLIELIAANGKKFIRLTKKGLDIYNKLLEIDEIIT